MKTISPVSPSLDHLAATTVRLGRELNQLTHAVYAGGNVRDFGFVERTLRRMAERDPFDERDDASLDAMRGILDADIRGEILGSERRFVETHFDADGQHGEVRDCPVFTERGMELLRIQEVLARFMAARDATLDQIAAERALLRLLRT